MTAKKKAVKKTDKKKASGANRTTVRAVTPQGNVYLSNGEKVTCGVGRHGPLVSKGDVFVKKSGKWIPKD